MSRDSAEKPKVFRLSRRQFLALSGAAVGATGIAVVANRKLRKNSRTGTQEGQQKRISLPDRPSHNPGFLARQTPDEGLVLWANQGDRRFVGYRLNARGRSIWRLCDGARTPSEITAEYATLSGRQGTEAQDFLREIMQLGLVVSGGHIVASGEFPIPPDGGCYHLQTNREEPKPV